MDAMLHSSGGAGPPVADADHHLGREAVASVARGHVRDVAANTERIMRSMAAMLPPKYRGYYKDGVARANGVGEALRDEFGAATDKQLAER
jgi:hypothetical protein